MKTREQRRTRAERAHRRQRRVTGYVRRIERFRMTARAMLREAFPEQVGDESFPVMRFRPMTEAAWDRWRTRHHDTTTPA